MTDEGLSTGTAAARYEAERRQGDAIAAGLEAAWGWTSPAGRLRAARRANILAEAADLGPGVRCLELGPGTGEFTGRLARTGCTLVALEISEATAEICRQRVGPGVEVVVGNAETGEGLDCHEFDAIVGVSVLHHLNLAMCLNATIPLLRRGGRFAFSEPNRANPQIWAERHIGVVKRRRHVTDHETAFTAGDLRRAFEDLGLEVQVAEPFEFLHPATPLWAIGSVARLQTWLERTPVRALAGSVLVAGQRP